MDALERRIRQALDEDYAEDIKDADPEWLSDVIKSLLGSPYLTKQGLSFEFATRWHDFVVILPYDEARTFLKQSILQSLAK